MTGPIQLALMVGPFAVYLYVLGVWQSGRSPRVVAGPLDYLLLVFAITGLLLFGPIGRALIGRFPASQGVWAGLALLSSIGMLALPWLPRSFRRLVIYNIDPETLGLALAEALGEVPGRFERTLRGFEARSDGRGIWFDASHLLRTGVVEAYGRDPEGLIDQVGAALRDRLRGTSSRPSPVAWVLLGLCIALLAPATALLLSRPQTQEVLRALIDRLRG
jgi:hypothetical protein